MSPGFEVLEPGTRTTVLGWPGQIGFRSVGLPASGPMDDLSFRLGNAALGNPGSASGLEMTGTGPTLRFHGTATVMVTGAPAPVMLDATPVGQWTPLTAGAGSVLEIGAPAAGMRTYLLVRGGLAVGERELAGGDQVPLRPEPATGPVAAPVAVERRPSIGTTWELAVVEGPHGAPTFVTESDVECFYDTTWTVHPGADRARVRLVGPQPGWARRDGGEAGPHPSVLHPTPYAAGAVAFDADLPVLLGPEGPTLGGATCPATVVVAHRWRLGQLRPGDTVRFVPVSTLQADDLRRQPHRGFTADRERVVDGGTLLRLAAQPERPRVTFRRSGDDNLLVEYGEMTLDLGLPVRVHALADSIARRVDDGGLIGLVDVTPGARSLQLHVDPATVRVEDLLAVVRALDDALPPTRELTVPSRTVHLPLALDHPSVGQAMTRYRESVRPDAPWCPDTFEYLRRVNGLGTVDDVRRSMLDAEHLVLGLGAGGAGGPLAVAVDPRHRLRAATYTPSRTWTPPDAVGLAGPYLRVQRCAGPGRDQLVGRTVPLWSAGSQHPPYEPGVPWLLQLFDRIRWFPVGPDELDDLRHAMAAGTATLAVTPGVFSLAEHRRFLDEHTDAIADFTHVQSGAFAAERLAWERSGEPSRAAAASARASRL